MNINITKLKIGEGGVTIEYTESNAHGNNKVELVSKDKPVKEFQQDFQAVMPYFLELCELPKSWAKPGTKDGKEWVRVVINSISFKENDRGLLGAVISATRALEHCTSPMNLHSPLKYERNREIELKGDGHMFLVDGLADLLHKLRNEHSIGFINGDRLGQDQMELTAQPASAPKVESDAEDIEDDSDEDADNDSDTDEEQDEPKPRKKLKSPKTNKKH